MESAVIVDVVRTASGKGKAGGGLSGVHPVDLLATVLAQLVERNGLDPAQVDDVIGGCVCFLAARYVGWSTVERLTGDSRMAHLNGVIDRGLGGWRELLFFRVTFPAIYNLLSYAAGSTKLPFRQYLAVTAFGGIVHTSILVILGASIALRWEARVAAYAGIAVLAMLGLFGVRHLRSVLARGT